MAAADITGEVPATGEPVAPAPTREPRPSLRGTWLVVLGLAAADVGVAAALSTSAAWDQPVVIGLLLVLAVVADRFEIEGATMRLGGSFPALVLAALICGPAPAALIGAASCLQLRKSRLLVLADMAIYGASALLAGAVAGGPVGQGPWWTQLLASTAAFVLASALAFLLVAVVNRLFLGRRLLPQLRDTYLPLVVSHVANGVVVGAIALLSDDPVPTILLAAGLNAGYFRLQRDLINAKALERESRERALVLARTQFSVIRVMVESVHARDRMTARHSAAVARYCRLLAQAAGCDEHDQELAHTAGLLHDIGKLTFSDRILWSAGGLDDEQWHVVRGHPEAGAQIVGRLEDHEEVAAAIRAHHERWDGRGYPHGVAGEQIPLAARIIAVADTYDVLTARDSYRRPVPPTEAAEELRRSAGTQLDGGLVELFVERVLAGGIGFGHGDAVDFEAELGFEERTAAYAAGSASRRGRLQGARPSVG